MFVDITENEPTKLGSLNYSLNGSSARMEYLTYFTDYKLYIFYYMIIAGFFVILYFVGLLNKRMPDGEIRENYITACVKWYGGILFAALTFFTLFPSREFFWDLFQAKILDEVVGRFTSSVLNDVLFFHYLDLLKNVFYDIILLVGGKTIITEGIMLFLTMVLIYMHYGVDFLGTEAMFANMNYIKVVEMPNQPVDYFKNKTQMRPDLQVTIV